MQPELLPIQHLDRIVARMRRVPMALITLMSSKPMANGPSPAQQSLQALLLKTNAALLGECCKKCSICEKEQMQSIENYFENLYTGIIDIAKRL